MKKIGLLSDTHSFVDPAIFKHFKECDEIWHAGDIGAMDVMQQLQDFKPLRAVYGNIDDYSIRLSYPENLIFECEGVKVLITHIAGYPGKYNPRVRSLIEEHKPKLFICGHSHILKVMPDKRYGLLHMNPGAIGNHGFHQVKTMLRFTIDGTEIKELDVIEVKRKV
jgi:putative phosphoesterase|tara:strand:+ start:1191 stop:1688 length:498 start_codon:yes stop_codon:yes gene_type:complete